MVRLARRASSQSNDPELYAALVSLCRYCGLQQASVAAHERARRLDGHVATSLMHTLIMMGDYARAAEEADPRLPGAWIPMALSAHANASRGFVPYHAFLHHTWLDPLRHRPEFIGVLEQAKKRQWEAQAAFLQAGGEALLGAGTAGPRT
jgi:hypothetical protein